MRGAIAGLLALGCTAIAAAQSPPGLRAEAFMLRSFDGRERAAERVRLTVSADPETPGRTFELAFHRLKAAGTATRPPLIFLMGGPGVPATVMAPIPPYFTLFTRLAEGGDVILLDQRGLGDSTPKTDCPAASTPLPADVFERPETLFAAFAASYKACLSALPATARPADFGVERVADDVDAIRHALGAPQVDLLAFSFGSRIALEVLRRHPGRVRKVVLQGVLGVETLRQPSLDDAVFRRFAAMADAQAAAKGLPPSVAASIRTVQARAAATPLPIAIETIGGQTRHLRMGPGLVNAIAIGRAGDPALAAVFAAAVAGDLSLLARWAQSLYQDLEKGGGSLMARALVCSTASPEAARRQAAREAAGTLLGEAFDNRLQDPAFCEAIGVRPPAAQPAVASRVPALLISGTLDPRTPPDRAEVTRKALAGSEHVVVEHGGHELLPVPAVQDLVAAFLEGRPERPPLALAPPEILGVDDARRPPPPRR